LQFSQVSKSMDLCLHRQPTVSFVCRLAPHYMLFSSYKYFWDILCLRLEAKLPYCDFYKKKRNLWRRHVSLSVGLVLWTLMAPLRRPTDVIFSSSVTQNPPDIVWTHPPSDLVSRYLPSGSKWPVPEAGILHLSVPMSNTNVAVFNHPQASVPCTERQCRDESFELRQCNLIRSDIEDSKYMQSAGISVWGSW